jgi:hypothetical protein
MQESDKEIVEKNEDGEKIEVSDEVTEEPMLEKIDNLKEKKHQKALRLVNEAKKIVYEADSEHQSCKLLLEDDLKEFNKAKEALRLGGFDACISLLSQLGYTNVEQNIEEVGEVFVPKEELAPLVLKDISSGKFTGALYALVGGVVSAVGLTYLATEELGITLDVTKMPSKEILEKLAIWFSTAAGLEPSVYTGSMIFGVSVVGVMAVIYGVRVMLKAHKNVKFATRQLAQAEAYTQHKSKCKEEMDRVDAHMKEALRILKLYEVILNEQKGKLERILHIEGSKEKSSEYHVKSYAEIRETRELIRTIERFVRTPMSKEGHLSQESVEALRVAKSQIEKMLQRLY